MTVAKLRDICLGVLFWFYDFMLEITTMGRKMVFHGGRWESAERFDELSKYMFHYPKKFINSQKRRVGMRRDTSLYVGKPVYTSDRVGFLFVFFGYFFVFFQLLVVSSFFGWFLVFRFMVLFLVLGFWQLLFFFGQVWFWLHVFDFDHGFGFVLGQAALERTLCADLRYPCSLQVPTSSFSWTFWFLSWLICSLKCMDRRIPYICWRVDWYNLANISIIFDHFHISHVCWETTAQKRKWTWILCPRRGPPPH